LTPSDTLLTEIGKDIDRRTNTTVSRPGQFSSCSPNNVVIHRGWLPAQQQPAVSPARRGASSQVAVSRTWQSSQLAEPALVATLPIVGQASLPACTLGTCGHLDAQPPNLPSRKTIGKQPFFAFPVGGGCKVPSTGARGASINIRAQNARSSQTVGTGNPAGPSPRSGEEDAEERAIQ